MGTLCYLLSSLTFFGPNLGLPFGYYGELNRTTAQIEAIDGVTITDLHVNYDVSVEEFTADVLVDGTFRTTIYIPDASLSERLRVVAEWEEDILPTYRE